MLRKQPRKKPLSDLISFEHVSDQSEHIKQLVTRAEGLQSLETDLLACLPGELRNHFKFLNIEANTLYLLCHSAALKMRLAMAQAQILANMKQRRSECRNLRRIVVRIRPDFNQLGQEELTRQSADLSDKNRQLLALEAEQTADPGLKAALMKLAKFRP